MTGKRITGHQMERLLIGMFAHDRADLQVGGEVVKVNQKWCVCRTLQGVTVRFPVERAAKGRPGPGAGRLREEEIPGLAHLVKLCNCSKCDKELVGATNSPAIKNLLKGREQVAGRVNDRPLCGECFWVWKRLHGNVFG